ncbi:hypothetical protein J6590_063345 [Homalodisca vitripennis]|nr:hypothetical protein J6590_063345 [Homalodisca vitripennis]
MPAETISDVTWAEFNSSEISIEQGSWSTKFQLTPMLQYTPAMGDDVAGDVSSDINGQFDNGAPETKLWSLLAQEQRRVLRDSTN